MCLRPVDPTAANYRRAMIANVERGFTVDKKSSGLGCRFRSHLGEIDQPGARQFRSETLLVYRFVRHREAVTSLSGEHIQRLLAMRGKVGLSQAFQISGKSCCSDIGVHVDQFGWRRGTD